MPEAIWMIKGREFAHCNCAYGCPCQFKMGRLIARLAGAGTAAARVWLLLTP